MVYYLSQLTNIFAIIEKDEVANIRGKVEICKDQNEKMTKQLGLLDDNLNRNRDSITKLENKIDQVRSALQGLDSFSRRQFLTDNKMPS